MNKRSKKKGMVEQGFAPVIEQAANAEFNRTIIPSQGVSWRRVPVIVTLTEQGKLSERQFNGLCRYRDIGLRCDRSPIRDSCDFSVRGTGEGMPPAVLRALSEMGWLERELGSLQPIAYAIAIDDVTLDQWAIMQGGSITRQKEEKRKLVTWIAPRQEWFKRALADIRMAGERLSAAIGV